MANYSTYILDVLANNPTEMNQIAERLKQPSPNIVGQYAFTQIQEIVLFEPVTNLGYIDVSMNKARRFKNGNSQWRTRALIDGHLFEVSAEFPEATFLLEELSESNYASKYVIRAGKVFISTTDDEPKAQMCYWVLLDIFAPFRSEYENGEPFGSLLKEWVLDVYKALQSLPCTSPLGHIGAPCTWCGSMALSEMASEQRIAEALEKQSSGAPSGHSNPRADEHEGRPGQTGS